MKNIFIYIVLFSLLFSCNQENKKKGDADSSRINRPLVMDTSGKAESIDANADSALLDTSRIILTALKKMDIQTLTRFINPSLKLRFSPYAFIDTTGSKAFTPYELTMAAKKLTTFTWGYYDGSGEPIKMNVKEYFKKFVYNKDFLNAPQYAANTFLGQGNSLNNLQKIYPGSVFTEFYFPGSDAKYNGMDWQTLRLVFKHAGRNIYLIAIVHDQWTI